MVKDLIKEILIVFVFASVLIVGAQLITRDAPRAEKQIHVEAVSKPVYRQIRRVWQNDTAELWTAAQRPIEIKKTVSGNVFQVTATDGYKETSQMFKVSESSDWQMYCIVGGVAAIVGGVAVLKILK